MAERRVIFLTGAASGIGRDAALRFLKQGDEVVGGDKNAEGLKTLADAARGIGGVFQPVELDLSKTPDGLEKVLHLAKDKGRIDVLVNCAGICSGTALDEMTEEEWDKTFAINVRGPFFLTQKLLPYLKKSSNPSIINVSSMAGFTGGIQSNPAYSSSKAAVTCMTKNLAKFCAPFGIRVNEVAPGTTRTAMTENWLGEEGLQSFAGKVLLGRLAEAPDVSKVILFLASDAAGFLTGQTVHVNGGMYLP